METHETPPEGWNLFAGVLQEIIAAQGEGWTTVMIVRNEGGSTTRSIVHVSLFM